MSQIQIRSDPDGTIDEIVTPVFHLEMMSDECVIVILKLEDGRDLHVEISSEAALKVMVEIDP